MSDDIRILIGSGASDILARKCIGAEDIKKAIIAAERGMLYFEDAVGVRICALKLENLTYWVSYSPVESGVFEMRNAYYHRMKFEETE